MSGLQVGVGAIQAMAHPIVLEHQNLVIRLNDTAQLLLGNGVHILTDGVFVNVVAEVQHHIEVRLGNIAISVEEPLRVVRARRHRHFKFAHHPRRQRAGATHRRGHAMGHESIAVACARREARSVDFDGVVALGAGSRLAVGHNGLEGVIGRDLPGARHRRCAATTR